MSKLKRAIEAALPDVTSLGGGGRNIDRDRLINLLGDLGADLGRAYWVRIVVALSILCLLFAVIWRYSDQPALLAVAMAAVGITLTGALTALKQVTDELARVDLIRAIAPNLNLDALTEVARRIVSTI
jgi:hypothetical protein